MENMNMERFEKAGLVIDKERVLSYSKLICPLGCKYCFSDGISNAQEKSAVYLSEEQSDLLENLPDTVKTIMLGCDTEFFQNKQEAISTIKKLSVLGKDLSVITKLNLGDDSVENLKVISEDMNKRGNIVTFSVSIPCFESSYKWEPKAPKVEDRIETLKRISDAGIDSMVAIRPLIPNLDKSEIDKIIDQTNSYVFGYYSGPLYIKDFDNGLLSKTELTESGCSFEEIEPHWMPRGNKFIKIENPDLMSYLHEKIKLSGKEFFEGAAQGMEFLRKSKNV
jgi:DNA repair photolyase